MTHAYIYRFLLIVDHFLRQNKKKTKIIILNNKINTFTILLCKKIHIRISLYGDSINVIVNTPSFYLFYATPKPSYSILKKRKPLVKQIFNFCI